MKTDTSPKSDLTDSGSKKSGSSAKVLKKSIFFYGALSGASIILINTVNLEMGIASVWLGFLVMFIALSVIFVAVKQQRDEHNGGVITFKQAFTTGISIAAIATLAYVLVWEFYLHKTDFKFVQVYNESIIMAKQAEGATEAEIEEVKSELAKFEQNYSNPVFRLPMTALEIFPVGLLISLVSAGVLRNHGNQRKSSTGNAVTG